MIPSKTETCADLRRYQNLYLLLRWTSDMMEKVLTLPNRASGTNKNVYTDADEV